MKEYVQTVIVFIIMLCLIPCLVFLSKDHIDASVDPAAQTAKINSDGNVKIYFIKEKKSREYTMEEYMTGAVLAQMPADFEAEALKAQAVLAKTYICCRRQAEEKSPTAELNGCLISDDTNLYQGFFTEEQAKEFYGDDYESAYKKVNDAVKKVSSLILTYKDEPVLTAFHAVSSGYTESALNAWGIDYPYLQSVDSKQDLDIEGMQTTVSLTADEVKTKLEKLNGDINFTSLEKAEEWIDIQKQTEHGYVTALKVCSAEISVQDFISALGIESPCFTVEFSNTKFTFKCKGYGHLVGMSQYGANSMAKDGKDFKEILGHYYTDCEIKKL